MARIVTYALKQGGSLLSRTRKIHISQAGKTLAFFSSPSHHDVGRVWAFTSTTRAFSAKEGDSTDSNKEADGQEVPINVEFGNKDDEDGNAESSKDDKEVKVDPSEYTEKIEIRMPDMGEGEGNVVKWYKQEGDVIKYEDTLCDIETPDFTFGMTTDDEDIAIMGEILVPAGSDPVDDGTVLCITLHKPDKDT